MRCVDWIGVLPQHGDDGDEASEVEENDEDFDLGQRPWHTGVDEDRHHDGQVCEQRALPQGARVVRVVENDQPLEDGAREDRFNGDRRDPGHRRQPADDVAAEDLVLGRQHVHPVVLAAGDGRHGRQLGDDGVH